MLLKEAKEILENNGYIIEGWKDDRAEWEKVKAKKYNGEKYRKWSETFNLGCGFTAQMIAAHPEPNPLYHQSAKIYIRYKNHEVASCWLHEQETLDDSNIKGLKREILQYAAKEVRDDDELDKILRNLNKVLNKINRDWWSGANKRNARADIVDKERKRREAEARSKFHDSWNTDMEDKVGEKVTYKNRNGYKHGQIVGVIEDKDNKEKYYKVKWNDNGKTQKINVKDSALEPMNVEWYPRW
jgi:hypothetical protein